MGDFNLLSLNVRGIKTDLKKIRKIFENFPKIENSLVFLQEYNIFKIIRDPNGRYIIMGIKKVKDSYIFVNIYAPTQNYENEQISVINQISDHLTPYEGKKIIMGGDFNVVLEPVKDKKGGNTNYRKGVRYRS